jgi:hypothetical protein
VPGQQQPPAGPPPDDWDEGSRRRLRGWLADDPPGHGMTFGVPCLWLAGWVGWVIGMTPNWSGLITLIAVTVTLFTTLWIGARPVPEWADPPDSLRPAEASVAVALAGGWLTAAARYSPAWNYWTLTWALAAGWAVAWYGWLRPHDAVQAARARRADETTWEERKAFWGDLTARIEDLAGCDLLQHFPTLLGEQVLLDTRGTGRLATSIHTRTVQERIGELWYPPVPRGRIDCWVDDMHGRLWISIRSKDPWKLDVTHPLLDRRSPVAPYFDAEPTARRPLMIGVDPEDGESFGLGDPPGLPIWIPGQGGQVILVVGTKGAGKTVCLNDVTERLTACEDTRVLQVNLTAPAEMRAWSAACPANALGRAELGRARALLAWVENYINDWGDVAGEAIATPTRDRPHLAVIIDEVAGVAADDVCKARMLAIAQLCRKAGVTLFIAGQRATAKWLGGADLRALIDMVLVGRFARPDEIDKAVGVHLDLPDFTSYGKGKAGVFMLVNLTDGEYDRGRTFKLSEPRDCARIAAGRRARAGWTPPDMPEDQQWLWAKITGPEPVGLDDWQGPPEDREDSRDAAAKAILDAAEDIKANMTPAPKVEGVPADLMPRLMNMINKTGGVSVGEVAKIIGCHPETARKYLTAIARAGHAHPSGNTRGRRYHSADRPPLTVIDGDDEDG